MQGFRYKAYRTSGAVERGTVEAADRQSATHILKERGLRTLELHALNQKRDNGFSQFLQIFAPKVDYTRLFSDLSVLMNAGLAFDRALKAISLDDTNKTNKQFVDGLLLRLAAGSSPSNALTGAKGLRPDVTALVASGEQSGRLVRVFSILAQDFELQQSQRKLVVEALIYPAFLVAIMLCALLVITFVLVPAIEPIFESSGRNAPFVIAMFSVIGRTLAGQGVILLLVFLASTLGLMWLLKKSAVRASISRTLLSIPIIGALIQKTGIARYLQSLSLLLENGVDMPQSLRLSSACCPVSAYKAPLLKVQEQVLSGKRLPEAFGEAGIFPSAVISLAAIGDEVNKLPAVLANASSVLRSDAQRTIDRLLTLMTPAITILLGALVGGLVISVMSALLSINEISVQ